MNQTVVRPASPGGLCTFDVRNDPFSNPLACGAKAIVTLDNGHDDAKRCVAHAAYELANKAFSPFVVSSVVPMIGIRLTLEKAFSIWLMEDFARAFPSPDEKP